MAELKAMGEACGLELCRTYIASGNLLFTSDLGEAEIRTRLEAQVAEHFGRFVPVHVRNALEMADTAAASPFADAPANRTVACFIDEPPVQAMLDEARDVQDERLALGPRAIYISYGEGIADSKLKLPAI